MSTVQPSHSEYARRVVVTGLGVVSSLGLGAHEFWDNLLAGQSGISEIELFDTSPYGIHLGGEVKNFPSAAVLSDPEIMRMGRASQMAATAGRMALLDARVDVARVDPERAGICIGTTTGEQQELDRFNDCHISGKPDRVGRGFLSSYPCSAIAANMATAFQLAHRNVSVISGACASGNFAIGRAYDLIRWGRADLVLAGGTEPFSRVIFGGFVRLGSVAPIKCQPFDRNRMGLIPAEGAAALVLESLQSALERRSRIYAEVGGYGLSCDSHNMMAPHPEGVGAAKAMRLALARSGIRPEEVSYISAHGTGTPSNDRIETIAMKKVFGANAYRIPVSSIKSMIGHTMGAAAAIEAVACALAVHNNRLPPTINQEEADPECDLDYVPNRARAHVVEVAMNNANGFGGNNASLIFRKCHI